MKHKVRLNKGTIRKSPSPKEEISFKAFTPEKISQEHFMATQEDVMDQEKNHSKHLYSYIWRGFTPLPASPYESFSDLLLLFQYFR